MPRGSAATRPAAEADRSDEEVRRDQILEGAMRCFVQLGISKTSIQDVARMTNVSRGTVYRYFEDRQTLIDATVEYGARQYYANAAAAMDAHSTLAAQAGAFAEVAAATLIEHRTRNRLAEGDDELMHHYASDSLATLQRTTTFLLPYVEAAKKRGEIGRNVKPLEASEWLARQIMSITATQEAITFDMSKPKSAGRFVEKFIVNGLR